MASSPSERPVDPVGLWLKRIALATVIVLLACCSWFVWRISGVAYQAGSAIASISADLKQMSTTGAQISTHLQKLDNRLQKLEEKAASALQLAEFEHVLDEVDAIRSADDGPGNVLSPTTEQEIKYLLRQVRRSKYRFTYDDEDKGGMRFYLQLYTKYKAYDDGLSSAEDFIDKAATKSITGHPYQVVISPEQSVPLNEWLSDELTAHRATKSTSESAGQ